MINIKELTQLDIGRWVLYITYFGEYKNGRIKSFNDKFIFVVYNCDFQWDKFQDYTGRATNPEDLGFINKGEVA